MEGKKQENNWSNEDGAGGEEEEEEEGTGRRVEDGDRGVQKGEGGVTD